MRKVLIGLGIIVVIAVTAYFYLRNNKLKDFEPDIKEKLDKLVQQASHGLYHLDIDTLDTDVLDGKIVLTNAHLWADTAVYAMLEKQQKAPNDLFDVRVKQLSIDDIEPANFLTNKEIILRRLFINQPMITVFHKKQPYQVAEDSSRTIYQLIQKDINNIKVDSIIVNDIDLVYKNVTKKKEQRLLNVRLFMEDLLIDSSTQFDTDRFFFAKRALISLKKYTYNTPDSLYRFAVNDIDIKTNSRTMSLKQVSFQPRGSIERFYQVLKHQQDRFNLSIHEVTFQHIDWWSLLAEESFLARSLNLAGGSIKIYNDRSLPPNKASKLGKYPHQLLVKLPFDLKIDTVHVNNVDLSYEEKNPLTDQTGTIYFDNVHATVRNVTNIREEILRSKAMIIDARARFMKESPVSAHFKLDLLNASNGGFAVTTEMGPVSVEALNSITRPLGMVEIKSLKLHSVSIAVTGNNNVANSKVKILYEDLKINALKEEDHQLKKKGLLSFIANHFVIKTENPAKGKPARVETGSFIRDPSKSFFNLIWKSTFVAAGKTVGFKAK